MTEEAHAHVCMNGFGEGRDEEAVVGFCEAWRGAGGAGLRSHISTVTPGFVSAAEPSGLALSGAEARLKVKCRRVVALMALVEGFKLPKIFFFFFAASLPLRF